MLGSCASREFGWNVFQEFSSATKWTFCVEQSNLGLSAHFHGGHWFRHRSMESLEFLETWHDLMDCALFGDKCLGLRIWFQLSWASEGTRVHLTVEMVVRHTSWEIVVAHLSYIKWRP
jgi:hypothetical protein